MSARVLGVDLGGNGATVEMSETGDIIAIHDNPTTKEANGRSSVNAPLWAPILARSHARVAFIEWTAARPTDARVAAFSFGRCCGLAEGICGALSIPIVWLTPPVWKRLTDIPAGTENKDLARTRAIARWPAHAEWFKRKCDIDRAEACLTALAGLRREARMSDDIEAQIVAGAIAALRKRADRQVRIARAETTTAERGARVMTGEGRVAIRLAEAFNELAAELDAGGGR